MDIIGARIAGYPTPRWTQAVWDELSHSADEACRVVLEAAFLGNPFVVPPESLYEIFSIRKGISELEGSALTNLGEAETIWVADKLNGCVLTDDYDAFNFAERQLGDNRVLDTIDLLREAVRVGDLEAAEAKQVVDAIRNCGRHLRPGHPPTITPDYFLPGN